jgi:hypothetical protein
MQQSLGKEKKNLKGFFLCFVFMKGQTLKLGSLGGTLVGSFKKKIQRLVVHLALSSPLFMVVLSWVLLVFLVVVLLRLLVFVVMLSWALLVFLVIAFMGFVGVYGCVILVSTIVHVVGP